MKDIKAEARKRLREFPGAGALGLTLELMTIEDVEDLIDKAISQTWLEAIEIAEGFDGSDIKTTPVTKIAMEVMSKHISQALRDRALTNKSNT